MFFSNFIEFGIATFITILLSLYFYLNGKFRYWKNKNVPYPKPVHLFGNVSSVLMFRETMGELFSSMYNKITKPLIGFFVCYEPCLLICDPELIKHILVSDFQYFNDRMVTVDKNNNPIAAHILFLIKNPEWKELRTKITPVYSPSKIKNMFKLIEDSANEMVGYINETIKINSTIEVRELFQKYNVDVISSTAFGVEANCFKNEKAPFRIVAQKILNWSNFWTSLRIICHFWAPKLVKIFKMKFFRPDCIEFLKNCFSEVMDKRKKSKVVRNDLIDILLQIESQNNTFIESDKLVSQSILFLLGGLESLNYTLTFALYEIAHNQQIQEKLRNEINQISEEEGINYESIKKMTYLEMCIKETLRKYPLFPFLDRRCNADYKLPGTDIIIEKGTACFIPVLALHHDPKYYPNPEIFDPERFSKTNNNQSPFLAFGEGQRACLGARFGMLTAKLGLIHVFQNFTVKICDQTEKKIKFHPKNILLSPLNGIKLKFVKKI